MKLPKFLSVLCLLTMLSLLYVRQQTEIFRLAYDGQKSLAVFEDLLDKNTLLRYNISKYASLVRIGSKVSRYADFQMPDTYRLVKLASSEQSLKLSAAFPRKENIISRVFGLKNQAEAKTINP